MCFDGFMPPFEVFHGLLYAVLQVEHGVLGKEHMPSFVQQISEVIELVHDNPQAAVADGAGVECQSVQPLSDADCERVADELDCGSFAAASTTNSSPPPCSSPSSLQNETKSEAPSEV